MNILESIQLEPEKWSMSEYTFDNKDGIRLWVNGGKDGLRLHPGPKDLMSRDSKKQIWLAIQWWCENARTEWFKSGSGDGK